MLQNIPHFYFQFQSKLYLMKCDKNNNEQFPLIEGGGVNGYKVKSERE